MSAAKGITDPLDASTDPAVSVCFTVTVDGENLGYFSSCEGLGAEVVMEQREEGGNNSFIWQLPSRIKYTNVKLSRAVGRDSHKITEWLIGFATDVTRKTACITAMTGDRQIVASWNLDGVMPVRWSGPSLNLDSPKVAMETLELAHHGFLPQGGGPMTTAIALAGSSGPVGVPGDAGSGGKAVVGRPTMDKAKLTVYTPDPAPGGYKPGAIKDTIGFQFNPKEVTIAKSAKWERKPAKGSKSAPPPEFTGSDPCKLTVEMFFDATGAKDGSVLEIVEKLFGCCVPTEQSAGQKKPTPPLVVLQWGSISTFPAVITSVSAKYTLFRSDGTPIRAICSVSMEEMPGAPPRQNPTSGSDSIRRVHRTVVGDNLASIAYAEYGDPAHWRPLAAYNGVDDPLRLPTGRMILLPSLEEMGVSG